MAYFAKLGTGNIVETVIVVSNDIATTEQAGVDFINNLYKTNDIWLQTSYNNNITKNYGQTSKKYTCFIWTYGLSDYNNRVATLTKLYLIVTEIILQSLKSIG